MVTVLALAVTGGAVAVVDQARKTVTLDVDGRTTTVTTFAGSVDGLLAAEGVRLSERDLVVPARDGVLRDGAEVVVRYGRQLTIEADGKQRDLWVTALDADEALRTLAERGTEATLVPTRSGERASLPLRLDAEGPVALVVGGEETVVPDGGIGLEAILEDAGVTLDGDDRIHVERRAADELGAPTVAVVVQRVEVEEVTETAAVPFETETKVDPDRYADQGTAVEQEGKDGVRTIVHRVVTVDGAEESREKLSDEVTTEPVTEVLVKGTKERPEPEPEPEPEPARSSTSSSSSSSSGSSGGSVPTGDVWAALAQCESGGDPTTNTGNGYYGMYQFSLSTWQSVGGTGLPSDASAAEQTMRAQILQQRAGWGQWPHCAAKLGLL
ncbi:resuscitation-promoting factor [Isoptericola variabilis]|uniref:Transglycosylase-like domain protein n=1 Tax=Isoptericola variabilis (strain 225) TaxID=743718 RepID=F6FSR4_ISOV2|nr:resuscitation-promoting factor [Isoptericola variabilis]AEG45226.1 Transglycosylase-like domain protein [Isoptericola variabilis 225]TWH33958.1 uncharacterized protein YabE (DUF348 family) [Isoptericola variabilis J7]